MVEIRNRVLKEIGILIEEQRNKAKISRLELANLTGLTYQMIYRYEKGLCEMKIHRLEKIAEILKTKISFSFVESEPITKEIKNKSSITAVPAIAYNNEKYIDTSKYKKIPVYSFSEIEESLSVAKTTPIDVITLSKEYALNGSLLAVKVLERGMEPIIQEGAYIGIDKSDRTIIPGNIYAVYLPYGGILIKKVYINFENLTLKSENKDFPNIEKPLKDINLSSFIIGRVKWVIQKL